MIAVSTAIFPLIQIRYHLYPRIIIAGGEIIVPVIIRIRMNRPAAVRIGSPDRLRFRLNLLPCVILRILPKEQVPNRVDKNRPEGPEEYSRNEEHDEPINIHQQPKEILKRINGKMILLEPFPDIR